MLFMFCDAVSFDQEISAWNTSSITTDKASELWGYIADVPDDAGGMYAMFYGRPPLLPEHRPPGIDIHDNPELEDDY